LHRGGKSSQGRGNDKWGMRREGALLILTLALALAQSTRARRGAPQIVGQADRAIHRTVLPIGHQPAAALPQLAALHAKLSGTEQEQEQE
jgi:hypothetical protein